MPAQLDLRARIGPFEGCLDPDLLERYAAAVGLGSPAGRDPSVPPVAIVTQIWDAQNQARAALLPSGLEASATGGVHGEHDLVLHRPVAPGEPLRTWVRGHGARAAGRNSLVTLRYVTTGAAGDLVAEQWWTTVLLNVSCVGSGEPAPDHTFPGEARGHPVGSWSTVVDADMARRYAEVSGDWSPHHFEVEAARRSGYDRPFLHGLCTMALCARAVVERLADGEPSRLRRVAVRFASPTFLGEELAVDLYDAGPLGCAFEATSAGAAVITHGRAELR